MKNCINLLAAAVLFLGFASLSHAQEPIQPALPAKANDGSITDVQLGEMLKAMGYEYKEGTYKTGAKYYDIQATTKELTLHVRLGLSPNKRAVWLMSYLGDLPADVTADQLKAILQAVNSKTGKMQFRLTGSQLKADQPMDNYGVTAARVKREIDDFATALGDTSDVWLFKKSEKAAAK